MDQVLESEVLVVVLQKPDGLTFGEFRKVFFSTHGYPLDLSRYGYSSLQRLLDDVRDLVLVEEAAQEPLIKCRSLARHQYLFLGEKELSSGERLYSSDVPEDSPANNQIYNTSAIVKASEYLARTLSTYGTGLKLRKLKELMKKEHGTDLEMLSKLIGYENVIDFLHQLPNIRVLNPSKPSNCLIQLKEGLQYVPVDLSSSQSSIASGVEMPTLSVVVCKDPDIALEEHKKNLSNKAVVERQQQHRKILPLGHAKSKNYIFQFQEDFKMLDFCEILNHNTPPQDSSTSLNNILQQDYAISRSASCNSDDTPPKSSPIPWKSSESPTPINWQNKEHNQTKRPRNSSLPTTQAKYKPKNTLPNKTSVPAKTVNIGFQKGSLQKQELHLKKTNNAQQHLKTNHAPVRSRVAPTNTSLYMQQQERYIVPQVSRLRTPTISYSSAVSRTKSAAPINRLAFSDHMVPSSTNINFFNMNQQSVVTHHEPPTFTLPISDFPQLSGKSQKVPPNGGLAAGNHLLTSGALPKSTEELMENILCVLAPYPNGMSLFQFQNTYRTMFNHKLPLNGYKNAKQLLEEMKEVVKVGRIGIQDWVSLISSNVVSTQANEEFDQGLHNDPGCEESGQNITVTTSDLNGHESSSRDEDQHKQAAPKALLHNLSEIKKTQNLQDAILNSHSTPQPLENTVLSIQNPSSPLNVPVTNEIAKQMPVSTLLSSQSDLQKQIHAIDNSSEHLLDGTTLNTNSHVPELHLKTLSMQQTAASSYSSISPCDTTVAPSNSFTSSDPLAASLSASQPLRNSSCTIASQSATQPSVSTSDHNHLTAEAQHDLCYRENTDVISDSSEVPKDMRQLKSYILRVLDRQPDGMSIFHLKKIYSFMYQHGLPLQGHSSVKQLLMAMPDAVKLRGLGVQMLVFPFSSEIHCSSVITEDNGFSLLEMENRTFPTIQDMAVTTIASSADMPLELNSSLTAEKQKFAWDVSSTSELPAMCMPRNNQLDPGAPIFSPSSPLFSDQFPSLLRGDMTSPLPLDSSRESSHVPSHCQTLTMDNDNAVPTPRLVPTPHLSKSKRKAAKSPLSVVCFKEYVDSPQLQNGRVNSAKQLTYTLMNQEGINSSHEEEFHDDNDWPALSKDLFATGTNQKTPTDFIPKKINNQGTRSIASESSKTKAAVKFVVFPDACNVKDLNPESYFYGSCSEIPTFGTVVVPLLGTEQNSQVELIKKPHTAQNYSKGKKAQ